MEIEPSSWKWQSIYKILIGSVVPRPIGWVSTLGPRGNPNLAPFSFFNVLCANPPHLMVSPMVRGTDSQPKDTLLNVKETGEFVVNIVTEDLLEAMNRTSQELPPEVDEFEVAHLIALPSVKVKPPRVAASPINFECRVAQIIDLGDQPGASSVIIGEIVYIHISEQVLIGDDKIDLKTLKPVGRLAGSAYCRVTDIIELHRPPSALINPG